MRPPDVPALRGPPTCIDAARSTREPLKAGVIPEIAPTNTAASAADDEKPGVDLDLVQAREVRRREYRHPGSHHPSNEYPQRSAE